MPSMEEIYEQGAPGYDLLVDAEDCEGNLCRALGEIVVWTDASVVEAGIGTGRVTRCYAGSAREIRGYDRSRHMLDRAAHNLAAHADRLSLAVADHRSLPAPTGAADIFVEGWAFGHAVVDVAGAVAGVTAGLVAEARRVVRPGGTIIVVETLGTNADQPAAPLHALAEFYRLLESVYGFAREVISTDYRFVSVDEAVERCGFFFGDEMAEAVRRRGSAVVPEYTGLWWARS